MSITPSHRKDQAPLNKPDPVSPQIAPAGLGRHDGFAAFVLAPSSAALPPSIPETKKARPEQALRRATSSSTLTR